MIHPQLMADCHRLGNFDRCILLLHRNAGVPWFILVPDTTVTDFLDLPAHDREAILTECAVVSQFIKRQLHYSKVNFAGLGNVVPQLHLHVIGRSERDPCWPSPVWGALPEGPAYDAETLARWQRLLAEGFALSPGPLPS